MRTICLKMDHTYDEESGLRYDLKKKISKKEQKNIYILVKFIFL